MVFEERTKLNASLLQFYIHVYFKLVDDIFNPSEKRQEETMTTKRLDPLDNNFCLIAIFWSVGLSIAGSETKQDTQLVICHLVVTYSMVAVKRVLSLMTAVSA